MGEGVPKTNNRNVHDVKRELPAGGEGRADGFSVSLKSERERKRIDCLLPLTTACPPLSSISLPILYPMPQYVYMYQPVLFTIKCYMAWRKAQVLVQKSPYAPWDEIL